MKQKLLFLLLLVCLAVGLFLSVGVTDWGFALPRRGRKVLTMILVGAAISYSTVLFQTITNNKILTPSIIGFDSLFVLMQTAFVFFFGSLALMRMDENLLFLLNAGSMILFAGALYRWLFNREGVHLYFLVLVGVVFGILFGNISNFMQKLLDPNEFSILQDSLFASIANADQELLMISTILILATAAYSFRFAPYLDVLSLGRDVAINLGVDHTLVINRLMIVIAIFVSISTALVGPITFFGLLVANLAYQVMQTHRHSYLVPAAILMSIVALVGGQFMLERVFAFNTTINVVINFVGGLYFLYLILMEARR
ncbi:MAG: iron chelate uptake ABC transporter family permease subunit [Chloroflexota bacterium]